MKQQLISIDYNVPCSQKQFAWIGPASLNVLYLMSTYYQVLHS